LAAWKRLAEGYNETVVAVNGRIITRLLVQPLKRLLLGIEMLLPLL
jgi:hypothetical protein